MTLIGKAFTFAVLVLSVIFMILALVANASHRNWKDVVLTGVNGQPGLKQQIETLRRTNDQLREQQNRLQQTLDRERAGRRTALASLQTQLTRLQDDLTSSEKRVQDLNASNIALAQENETNAEELQRLTDKNRDLRDTIRTEQQNRDKLFTQTLTLTDQMNQLRGFKTQLEERNAQLATQVTRFEEVIAAKGINVNDPLDGAPPERNGVILEVDRPRRLVSVSIGEDEGLRRGHYLEVTRGGRYVGKLQVRRTFPDRAVAEILVDYSEGVLQEDDRVDTTLD